VGDVRVKFLYGGKHGEEVTVVGKQSGKEILPYKTELGDEILIIRSGINFRKTF